MPIAVFGSKIFQITADKIYTFSDFQYNSTLQTEKQDADGKKPSTYNKGPGLDSLGLKIRLSVDLGLNPRVEMGEWLAIKDDSIAYPFILGGVPFRPNKWLLVDVQASDEVFDNQGGMLAVILVLKFDEYVRPGSASESSKKKGSSATAKTSAGIQAVDYKPATLTASEKEKLK